MCVYVCVYVVHIGGYEEGMSGSLGCGNKYLSDGQNGNMRGL